jgi:hypothetical protein
LGLFTFCTPKLKAAALHSVKILLPKSLRGFLKIFIFFIKKLNPLNFKIYKFFKNQILLTEINIKKLPFKKIKKFQPLELTSH